MASLGDIHEANLTANSDLSSSMNSTATTLSGLDLGSGGSSLNSAISSVTHMGAQSSYAASSGASITETYDFIGIANSNGVAAMQAAVKAYCDAINTEIDQLVTTADPTGTFAGNYVDTINEFLKAIKNSCLSTVNALTLFNKDLDQVYAQMQAHDTSVGASISGDAQSINSAANAESN